LTTVEPDGVFGLVAKLVKQNSIFDNKSVICTFVYVLDPYVFRENITLRAQDTIKTWKYFKFFNGK